MRHYISFMKTFRGYSEWDKETKEHALEILLKRYIEEYDEVIVPLNFAISTYEEIELDLKFYEQREEYEICVILKELQDHI